MPKVLELTAALGRGERVLVRPRPVVRDCPRELAMQIAPPFAPRGGGRMLASAIVQRRSS
jgi:hypothetical protein